MSELKTRVDELKMENEYQLRLKDMNYNEKIKDLTDKFLQEIESLKAKNEVNNTHFSKTCDMESQKCLFCFYFVCYFCLFVVFVVVDSTRRYSLIKRQRQLIMKRKSKDSWKDKAWNFKISVGIEK